MKELKHTLPHSAVANLKAGCAIKITTIRGTIRRDDEPVAKTTGRAPKCLCPPTPWRITKFRTRRDPFSIRAVCLKASAPQASLDTNAKAGQDLFQLLQLIIWNNGQRPVAN